MMDIEKRTKEVGKTYSFDNNHKKASLAQYWFQNPPEGLTLFVVFYTQACRWSQCLGCNLPSKMSQDHIPFDDIMMQIDFLFNEILSDQRKIELKKIILSNNGSVLDEHTFSTTALMYFLAKMNISSPNIQTLTIETRPEYVDIEELEVLSRALKEGNTPTDLEIAIGFEAFDDVIRNDYFLKGLSIKKFEMMVEKMAKYKYKLKTYFMMKPVPNMTEEQAVEDVVNGINYLDQIAEKYQIEINMHLNPTYAASGTKLAEAFETGTFVPPLLDNVRKAVLASEGKMVSVFVGLNDEGLAVPGGGFIRQGDESLVKKLEEFNLTQNYDLIRN